MLPIGGTHLHTTTRSRASPSHTSDIAFLSATALMIDAYIFVHAMSMPICVTARLRPNSDGWFMCPLFVQSALAV